MNKCLFLASCVLFLFQGCAKKGPPKVETPPAAKTFEQGKGYEPSSVQSAKVDDLLHVRFTNAVRKADNPPEGAHRPPDKTIAGKPVFQIYEAVEKSWDSIRFTGDQGQMIGYSALVETNFGEIEIELNPAWAPSHCRSFIALARAGYFDGLCFDRAHHEESDDTPPIRLDQLQAGCPLGLGEPGYGSIGYWMVPEVHPDAKHEEGTVGAYYDEDPETAACRFYINLTKAPFMDGGYSAFGKVTRGLNIAKKIHSQPVQMGEAEGKPVKPVLIRKVTIQSKGSVNTSASR